MEKKLKVKVEEFAESIKKSSVYREFIELNEKVSNDPELQELLFRFQQKRRELMKDSSNKELIQELNDLKTKIDSKEIIEKLAKAQKNMVILLRKTNDVISDKIETPFAQKQGGGCCG